MEGTNNLEGIVLVFCTNCGRYTDRVCREIGKPCTHKKTEGAKNAMRYIERGEHPRKRGMNLGRPFDIYPREEGEVIVPEPRLGRKKKTVKAPPILQVFGPSNVLRGLVGADWGSVNCEKYY